MNTVATSEPSSTPPMALLSVSAYARQVRPLLPKGTFAPARSRALWIPIHYAIITALIWALSTGRIPWPAWPLVSLLNGGVVRGRAAIRVVGWLGFLPFCISPQLWMGWHNRVHHNHCGQPGVDPDMYPTLTE